MIRRNALGELCNMVAGNFIKAKIDTLGGPLHALCADSGQRRRLFSIAHPGSHLNVCRAAFDYEGGVIWVATHHSHLISAAFFFRLTTVRTRHFHRSAFL